MISLERMQQIRFNTSELISIIIDEEFDRNRAGRWMDEHAAVFLYLITIFSLQKWMENRPPFKLQIPVAIWNFSIALLSGVCAATITPQFFGSWYNLGFNASLCATRDLVFNGANGRAIFLLAFARLPEFFDTYFIVLRKQPLIFLHYFHHAFTLTFGWCFFSRFVPSSQHPIYVNACIHTVMYSYYFLTTLKIRLPPIVAKSITIAQIIQFMYAFYGLVHLTVLTFLDPTCQYDSFSLAWAWVMDVAYLYLFIDFYMNKYKGTKKPSEKTKKMN